MKQAILADGSYEDIGETIVVVVRNGHTHAVHFDRKPRALRDIGEGTVTIVAVETQRGPPAAISPAPTFNRPISAVHQQNIEPAVALVIENRAARAERFREIFGSESAAVVMEVDAGSSGNIRQPETGIQRDRRSPNQRNAPQDKPPAGHAMLASPLRIA